MSEIEDKIAAAERYAELAEVALNYTESRGGETSPVTYAVLAQMQAAIGLLRVEAAGLELMIQRRRNYPRPPSKMDDIR
jgi:hypothetical protein